RRWGWGTPLKKRAVTRTLNLLRKRVRPSSPAVEISFQRGATRFSLRSSESTPLWSSLSAPDTYTSDTEHTASESSMNSNLRKQWATVKTITAFISAVLLASVCSVSAGEQQALVGNLKAGTGPMLNAQAAGSLH